MKLLPLALCVALLAAGCACREGAAKQGDPTSGGPMITAFLMFEGRADEAIALYTAAFPDSRVESLKRHGDEAGAMAGKVYHATVSLNGQRLQMIDSPAKHHFTFTPAISLHVACDTAAEVDALVARLGEGGEVFMPLDAYPFSDRYAWISDRFGVSWQIAVRKP